MLRKLKSLFKAFRLIFGFYFKPEKHLSPQKMEKLFVEVKIEGLIKKAEKRQRKKPDESYAIYQQVVAYIEGANYEDTEEIEESLLNALKNYTTYVLNNRQNNQEMLEKALSFIELGLELGLELGEKNTDYVLNNRQNNQEMLEEALFIELGLELGEKNTDVVKHWNYIDLWEVKVALLIKLERQEEAYSVIQEILEYDDPDEDTSFYTVSQSKKFKYWVANSSVILDK